MLHPAFCKPEDLTQPAAGADFALHFNDNQYFCAAQALCRRRLTRGRGILYYKDRPKIGRRI